VETEAVLGHRVQTWSDLVERKHRRLAVAGTKELEVVPSRVEVVEADQQVGLDDARVMRKVFDHALSHLTMHLVFEEAHAKVARPSQDRHRAMRGPQRSAVKCDGLLQYLDWAALWRQE